MRGASSLGHAQVLVLGRTNLLLQLPELGGSRRFLHRVGGVQPAAGRRQPLHRLCGALQLARVVLRLGGLLGGQQLYLELLIPPHQLLPPGGELRGVEAGEVALDEAKYQHVADRAERDDEDDEEGDEGEHVDHGAPQGLHLARLQGAAPDGTQEDLKRVVDVRKQHAESRHQKGEALLDLLRRLARDDLSTPHAEAAAAKHSAIPNAQSAAEVRDLARQRLQLRRAVLVQQARRVVRLQRHIPQLLVQQRVLRRQQRQLIG
mmetsp:Transcript_23708/g.59632  ORF Transcript_23708/g.59632 Transcript_23708/m.59632 type:complete len:262 (-) Transcript_23708:1360-2145(-)